MVEISPQRREDRWGRPTKQLCGLCAAV